MMRHPPPLKIPIHEPCNRPLSETTMRCPKLAPLLPYEAPALPRQIHESQMRPYARRAIGASLNERRVEREHLIHDLIVGRAAGEPAKPTCAAAGKRQN